MSFDLERLYRLLPAIHRIRDIEHGSPLRSLLGLFAEEIAVLEENLEQLYDDQFIETCAEWVVPYIGDLIGERVLHELPGDIPSRRADVGHAIALRRRKGTAAALEQVAVNSTAYPARVVEFFELLATTQYLNHLRLHRPAWVDVRDAQRLESLRTPFTTTARTADVRRIANRRGQFNIPHVGVFLYRVHAYSLTRSPARRLDDRRWLLDPLGAPIRLFQRPEPEPELAHLARPENVPRPLGRRELERRLASLYGRGRSLFLEVDGREVAPEELVICNLSDRGAGAWRFAPADRYAIDPVLGRIAFPQNGPAPNDVRVSFHYGMCAALGGGEYDRGMDLATVPGPVLHVPTPEFGTIQQALDALQHGGVVEIQDSTCCSEPIRLELGSRRIVIRSRNGARPHIRLPDDLEIDGSESGEITFDGVLVSGGALVVRGPLRRLRLIHTTLVPGIERTPGGDALRPRAASLVVEGPAEVVVERSILGALHTAEGARVELHDSVVDATHPSHTAYGGVTPTTAGGTLLAHGTTLIGTVHARSFEEVSNCILLARSTAAGESAAVRVERSQQGCIRFSYLPLHSVAPRRYRCQPTVEAPFVRPKFTSLRYGDPGYAQLDLRTPEAIRLGADDESELGALHHLYGPQREANLRLKLDEYLRFGLEAGIFYAS